MNQRNCLILGSGRSGTSMAAGILARAGYFMGAELWPADIGNPKGYFEDREVNKINDELIAPAPRRRRRTDCASSCSATSRYLVTTSTGSRYCAPTCRSHVRRR